MSARLDSGDTSHLRNVGVGKKILVIDDDKYARSISKKILREYGYEVTLAEDGIEGLKIMVENKPDLILLDMMMPKLSGNEVLEKMRSIDVLKDIIVLMVSANSEVHQVQKALSLGAMDYVIKPMRPVMMVERIVRALQGGSRKQRKGMDTKKQGDKHTYLLLLTKNRAFIEEISSNLPEVYKVDVLESTDDLPDYFGSSYCQFILADEESLDIPNAGKLSSTIFSFDRDSHVKPYLYYWSDFEQGDIDKYLMQGIEKCIKRPENPDELYDLFNENFEVNLVEEIRKSDELVLLRRREIKTSAAGREMSRHVKRLTEEGIKKFIIDLSILEQIKLEEIQHLSEFTDSQTKLGIKVCFVLSSKHVKQSFYEFIETVNVSVVDSVEEAITEIG